MYYMGSKRRIAKHIIPIMLGEYKGNNFYDLFCGGCNLIESVPDTYNRYANDYNEATYLAMLMIRDHVDDIPKSDEEFTVEDYKKLREESKINKTMLNSLMSFNSYGAKQWGGYRRDKVGKRDYREEFYMACIKQSQLITDVVFTNLSYDEVSLKPNSLLYCDPPYYNTTKYNTCDFDYAKFWGWCKAKKHEGHTVFVSEYTAPEWAECVWEKEIYSSLAKEGGKRGLEKLFKI